MSPGTHGQEKITLRTVWLRRAGLQLALLVTLSIVTAQKTPDGSTPSLDTVRVPSVTFMSMPPKAFSVVLRNAPGITLINVHVPYEGELPGTDAFFAFDRIEQQQAQLPRNKAAAIAIYCMSGRMSEVALRTLSDLGYTNVTELRGGMIAWHRADFPLRGGPFEPTN